MIQSRCVHLTIFTEDKECPMEDQRKIREQIYRLPNVSERAEHENFVNRFNKDEEQENIKNLLFGTGRLSHSKDVEEE